ncbi:MAG TPA: acetoacetate--CoA ligase [Solirubrobacteraceae bacterium]|nr:acetoacetate--CoA ligase [Solirubrobacteraceae bacterium]
MSEAPELLWEPSADRVVRSTLTRFHRWLEQERGQSFGVYDDLWRWSVDELDDFWSAMVAFFDLRFSQGGDVVLGDRSMPGAEWFPQARISYAEHVFRGKDDDDVAIRFASEVRPDLQEWTWGRLRSETARVAAGLRGLGVIEGDRVVAYMPNIPETVACFLACASIGAVWSSAAPEFGARSVVDRFAQVEPKVLLAVDGYRYGGKDFDRSSLVERIASELPGLKKVVRLGYLDGSGWEDGFLGDEGSELSFAALPFAHPLWVLYSSGTTGLPKPIVHGQGGILLEQVKMGHLHLDAQAGDRVFWFTTTGWMMWNFLVGVLLTEASIVLFDGNPGHPDLGVLWDLAEDARITTFGTSAAFIASCMKDGVEPRNGRELSALRAVGSTGSPLSPEGFRWVYDELGSDTWLFSTSGGTDMCTAFVGGVPVLPVYLGELQGRALGASVEAWDDEGRPLVDEVGELVISRPMPSMPVFFWGDDDGSRLRESYFSMYPGVWRHGDWIKITSRGTAVIYGRSDSTINRGGVRMGTAEIYRAVLDVDEVVDALVVDVPREGTEGWMPLFVVLREGSSLTDDLIAEIRRRIREDCSPRHVPNEVRQISAVPRTLSGKVLEVPVKRILMGTPVDQAASRESLANPEALDFFEELANEGE